jgi:hypothetical protein
MSEVEDKIKTLVQEAASLDTTIELLKKNRKEKKTSMLKLLKTYIEDTEMLKNIRFSGFMDVGRKSMRFGTFHVRTHEDRDWRMGYDTILRDVFKLLGPFAITVKLDEYTSTENGALRGFHLGVNEHDLDFEIYSDISKEEFRRIQKKYGFKVDLVNNESWLKTAKEKVAKYLFLQALPIPE